MSSISGELQKGYFRPLEHGRDYIFQDFSQYYGFFRLNEPVDNSRALAVSYQTNSKKVGSLLSDYTEYPSKRILNLKLIKCENLTPEYEGLWDLMLKNVYETGDSTLKIQYVDVSIEYIDNGKYYTFQPDALAKVLLIFSV